jgi:hypothetical protein
MKDRRFRFPISRPDDRAIPSGRPSDHCSILPDDVTSRPDAIRTMCISVRTLHFVEKFLSSLHPSGQLNCTSGRLSVLNQLQILSKFKYGKTDSTARMVWYPVWTRVSLRQESQFKYHPPDVSQPWSERACN